MNHWLNYKNTVIVSFNASDCYNRPDLLARTMIRPYEVPLAAVVAVIGFPFFLVIVTRMKKGGATDEFKQKTIHSIVDCFLVLIGLYLGIGTFNLGFDQVFMTLIGQGDRTGNFVILQLRLPRLIIVVFSGSALALSGVICRASPETTWPIPASSASMPVQALG